MRKPRTAFRHYSLLNQALLISHYGPLIVYKFGGALARSKRGLEAIARLVGEAYARELTRERRSASRARGKRSAAAPGRTEAHGLLVVVSAIGHTTRHLARAAELAEEGKLQQADAAIERILSQHEQLAATLVLEREDDLLDEFDEIGSSIRSLIEGVAITRELSPRTRDAVIAHGEQLAMVLIQASLAEHGVPVHIVDARNVILTNETFGRAAPITKAVAERAGKLIAPRLKKSEVVLIQGFVGATPEGVTTTMGNESSDLTATLLAAALGANEVVIWKTLPGIYSADPELVPRARLIRALSFAEAEEIGRRGARVLFPTFAHPLMQSKSATVMRIATPFGKSATHTVLTRELASPTRSQKALAIALEDRLVSIRIVPREGRGQSDRRKRERMQSALASAHATWSSPAETVVIVARDDRRSMMEALDREAYTVNDRSPLAAIAVVIRKSKSEPFDVRFVVQVGRSLRTFHVHALIPIEQSIVVFVDEGEGRAALRKLHHDLFEV